MLFSNTILPSAGYFKNGTEPRLKCGLNFNLDFAALPGHNTGAIIEVTSVR